MEEEDDDFYGGGGVGSHGDESGIKAEEDEAKEEQMDVSEDQEEEDSDDDVQFTLEKPPGAKQEPPASSRTTRQQTTSQDRAVSTDAKAAKSSTPVKQEQRSESIAPIAVKGTLTHNGKEGKDFPGIRTSKIDVDGAPIWPPNGKPITEVDIDADLAENSKPWRLPGTDQTDFFNYGFDEYTWAQYCLRQQTMTNTISEQKQADAQLKAMFGGPGDGGAGSNTGMPPGMPPMPGMPSPQEVVQQMAAMGMNPNDPQQFDQFMTMLMSGAMPGGMSGGQGQQNPQQGGRQQGGGFGGPNQNSISPMPPAGQGFQPPQGPGGQNQQGDQGGFPVNMEGYSPQQIAIMQQQQGGMGGQGGGGGGGRGRGRRGRGYY